MLSCGFIATDEPNEISLPEAVTTESRTPTSSVTTEARQTNTLPRPVTTSDTTNSYMPGMATDKKKGFFSFITRKKEGKANLVSVIYRQHPFNLWLIDVIKT